MQRPSYWQMSDPAENFQFRRGWEHPPPPKRRSPARLAGRNRADAFASTGGTPFNAILTAAQARAAAEVLFEREPAERGRPAPQSKPSPKRFAPRAGEF